MNATTMKFRAEKMTEALANFHGLDAADLWWDANGKQFLPTRSALSRITHTEEPHAQTVRPGDRVENSAFGQGVVLEVSAGSVEPWARVAFADGFRKIASRFLRVL